jgi:thiamine kinase-like enzyme
VQSAILAGVDPTDAERLASVPSLASASRVMPLPGGITNRNYRVDLPTGSVVVRLSDPESSDLAIDRHHEYLNTLAAASSGAGAPVVDYLENAGVLIVGWIEGRTFSSADVADPANLSRIAAACRQLHAGPRFASAFDMFVIQARYRSLVSQRGYRLPDRYDEFAPMVERMRLAMAAHPEPTVPCNNDLLAANFIDDGQRLWLIDYEYSGNNEASFELGNIWSESTLPAELLDPLVEAYWGRITPDLVARARLWALMSQYGWMLWAAIQEAISPIDFDYWSWGLEKYERAVLAFDGTAFEGWLDAAGGGGEGGT